MNERKPHTSWSREKLWKEQEQRELLKALRPYPPTVSIHVRIDGVQFETTVPGEYAIRMFKRDPGTREMIKHLEVGQTTPEITRTTKVSIVVFRDSGKSKATSVIPKQLATTDPFGTNPITGKPFSSDVERRLWMSENIDKMPTTLIITEPDDEEDEGAKPWPQAGAPRRLPRKTK